MKLPALPWPAELAARFGVTALVPVLVVGLSVVGAAAATGLPDGAAFRVGDDVVTEQEFDRQVDTLEAMYGVTPPADEARLDEFRRASAKTIATSMVLEDAARDRGIVVAEKSARDILTKKIEQDFQGRREGLADFLGKVGASEHQVIEAIRLQQSVGLLFRDVVSTMPRAVTDEEARRYYEEHRNELVQPETRRIRNLVVATEADAREVSERARAGADFAALVNQYSLDESTRATGGDLGFVARRQLVGPFGDAAFAAQPGTVFGPVQTQSGWNVSQVVEARPSQQLQFEQIAVDLRAEVARQRVRAAWSAWVEQRVRDADVRYAEAYRPAEGPPAPAPTAGGPLPEQGGHPQ